VIRFRRELIVLFRILKDITYLICSCLLLRYICVVVHNYWRLYLGLMICLDSWNLLLSQCHITIIRLRQGIRILLRLVSSQMLICIGLICKNIVSTIILNLSCWHNLEHFLRNWFSLDIALITNYHSMPKTISWCFTITTLFKFQRKCSIFKVWTIKYNKIFWKLLI